MKRYQMPHHFYHGQAGRANGEGFGKNTGERGAQIVELAIALPVFLALLFFLLWSGLIVHQLVSFRAAVGNAMVLAVTRGDAALMGFDPESDRDGLLAAVDRFVDSGSFDDLKPLLMSQDIDQEFDVRRKYDDWVAEHYTAASLRDVPREAIYAMVYLFEAMRMSTGKLVRFPCEPYGGEGLPPSVPHGAGCLKCAPLPPEEMALGQCPGPGCATEVLDPATGIPLDRFGLHCTLNADNGILSPLINLFGVSGEIGRIDIREWRFRHVRVFG